MIYIKTNPVGIDLNIQKQQTLLYNKLSSLWDCDLTSYGRIYKDEYKGIIKPLVYIGDADYKELLFDDTIKGVHFFFVDNDVTNKLVAKNMYESDVDIIFLINDIKSVKPTVLHFADEEIKEDIRKHIYGDFQIESIIKGKDALDGFNTDKLHFTYPFYALKFSTKLKYHSKCKL